MAAGNRIANSAVEALVDEVNDLQSKLAVLLAKLDADGGITDTNYAALVGATAGVVVKQGIEAAIDAAGDPVINNSVGGVS